MNVLIAEDHTLTATLLANLLSDQDDLNVVGVVSNGISLLKMVAEKPVDLCLLDISMPYLNGIEAMEQLSKKYPEIKVLVLTAHTERFYIEKSLELGAAGYLTKHVDTKEVVEAIYSVLSGDNYFDKISMAAITTNGVAKKEVKSVN